MMNAVFFVSRVFVFAVRSAAQKTLSVLLAPIAVLLGKGPYTRVSNTAFACAASRARESCRPDRLFLDPLAILLCGNKFNISQDTGGSSSTEELPRKATYVVVRTKYVDDAIVAALGIVPNPHFHFLVSSIREMGHGDIKQVVMLGAGMDSRPWRLDLPEHVRWFEIDRKNVSNAKNRLLKKAKAALTHEDNEKARFTLKAAKRSTVCSEVEDFSWKGKLTKAGYDSAKNTVWILEGLLCYLEPKVVPALLKALYDHCAPGSVLIATSLLCKSLNSRPRKGIAKLWKWGCPENHTEYFGNSGWDIVSFLSWPDTAKIYGCEPHLRSPAPLSERAKFFVAVRAA